MNWIFEKIFDLVQDILKGDFSDLDKLPALIAVIVIFGCFLARDQIWNAIQGFRKRVQDFARIKKFESEVEAKRHRIKQVVVDIEDKIYEIKRQNSLFETKKSEALERLKVLASTLPENSELYSLKENVNDLSATHELSVETIREIKHLLEQIIDVSRGEEMRSILVANILVQLVPKRLNDTLKISKSLRRLLFFYLFSMVATAPPGF